MSSIIIADRDKEVTELLNRMFQVYGFSCSIFYRPSALLWDALIEERQCFCILDIHFISSLAKKSALISDKNESYLDILERKRPVVMVTGAREPTDEEIKIMFRFRASFFEKPITPFSLLEFSDRALQMDKLE